MIYYFDKEGEMKLSALADGDIYPIYIEFIQNSIIIIKHIEISFVPKSNIYNNEYHKITMLLKTKDYKYTKGIIGFTGYIKAESFTFNKHDNIYIPQQHGYSTKTGLTLTEKFPYKILTQEEYKYLYFYPCYKGECIMTLNEFLNSDMKTYYTELRNSVLIYNIHCEYEVLSEKEQYGSNIIYGTKRPYIHSYTT